MIKRQDSFSSSASYASISSIPVPKSDSGYSETSSNSPTYSYLRQILHFERTYHEKLKQSIIKYSRPLRRVLNPQEIVELFQNIEKVISLFSQMMSTETFHLDLFNLTSHRSSMWKFSIRWCNMWCSNFVDLSINCKINEWMRFIIWIFSFLVRYNDRFLQYISYSK